MASSEEEEDIGTVTNHLGQELQSIFNQIEANLPTIDSDTSDVGSEEEVQIFDRYINHEVTLLNQPPLNGNDEQQILTADQPNNESNKKFNDSHLSSNTQDDEGSGSQKARPAEIMKEIQLEPNDFSSIISANTLHSHFIPIQSPVLQIPNLEESDIESIVNQIGKKEQRHVYRPIQKFTHDIYQVSDREEETDNISLMDKLTALAIQQGGEIAPSRSETSASKSNDDLDSSISVSYQPEEEKVLKESENNVAKLQLQNTNEINPVVTLADENKQTVFLDLRQEAMEEKIQEENSLSAGGKRLLALRMKAQSESSQDSDSSLSDEESNNKQWVSLRNKIKSTSLQESKKLQQDQQHQMSAVDQFTPMTIQKPQDKPYEAPKQSRSIGTNVSKVDLVDKNNKAESQLKPDISVVNNKNSKTTNAKQSIQQDKAKRQRLAKRIKSMKPKNSWLGFHPTAVETPVLFDQDVTFAQPPTVLPFDLNEKICMILKLPLIGLNEANISVKSKSVTTVGRDILSRLCLRHCYSLILTWLLSLLNKATSNYPDKLASLPPFIVVGLQQVTINGKLSIDVVITESASQKLNRHQQQELDDSKTRKRRDSRQSFYQSVYKYLSTTNFNKLFPWIIKKDNHVIAQCKQVNFHLPDGLHLLLNQSISSFIKVETDAKTIQQCLDHRHSYFWITLDTDDSIDSKSYQDSTLSYEYPFQTTILRLQHELYSNPQTNFAFFYEFWSQGFDISGLRLLYDPSSPDRHHQWMPTLYIALRGPLAIEKCRQILGPLDANLARRTDPTSLSALYCSPIRQSNRPLVSCTNSKLRSLDELCQIFGGRIPLDQHGQVLTDTLNCQQDIFLLAACVETSIVLILSPWIPIDHLPQIIKLCLSHGFLLQDMHRTSLTHGQIASLSMQKYYSNDHWKFKGEIKNNVAYPPSVTFLHLRRENALHQSSQLIEIIVRHLTPWIQNHDGKINTGDLIKILPYHDENLKSITRQFSLLPSTNPILLNCNLPPFYSYPDYEQVVVVNFTSIKQLSLCADAMAQLIHNQVGEETVLQRRLEIIGLKYIPQLPAVIASELSQFEVGHIGYKESIQAMIGRPAVSILIRAIDAFQLLSKNVAQIQASTFTFSILISQSPEIAYRQASLIFRNRELAVNDSLRTILPYIPSTLDEEYEWIEEDSDDDWREANTSKKRKNRSKKAPASTEFSKVKFLEKIFLQPISIVTILVIKPDAFHKVNKILRQIVQKSFRIVGLKQCVLTHDTAIKLVATDLPRKEEHIDHLTAGPSIVLCLQRVNAVKKLLDLAGPENPDEARKLDGFSWRSQYGSTSYMQAIQDVKLLFPEGLCCPFNPYLQYEQIICRAVDATVESYKQRRHLQKMQAKAQSKSLLQSSNLSSLSLRQITCILLAPPLLQKLSKFAFLQILDILKSANFEVKAMRMIWLTVDHAQFFHMIIDHKSQNSGQKVGLLTQAPCLIMAAERDNAISCFDSIIERFDQNSIIKKHEKEIFMAKAEKEVWTLNFL
ncbi:uncharacterized protein TRIADDRAFT_51377 [Trichoplax adhaerens]|uniref:Nucleoside diphosphate kinase-like domain-containing protein n=1 Tax=Trichoplax adhaerens TaxID=10228 RepID=B3RIU9_TRIAD|nr:hypothetical protein TRIADDRAFT_51377 [Trichoplax adhaerens]EDV29256.1 hypothetical protein TRIADDRAFT_51377 [Trichoplax adhaerens]|eukprot:XP_002108458.1 hypothetical protein TRIADDRAFT_51377 [Trichoplax adhaerens]